MKLAKLLAIAALVVAPIVSVNAAAPAQAAAAGNPPVASPAGWASDFSKFMCRTYGIGC